MSLDTAKSLRPHSKHMNEHELWRRKVIAVAKTAKHNESPAMQTKCRNISVSQLDIQLPASPS